MTLLTSYCVSLPQLSIPMAMPRAFRPSCRRLMATPCFIQPPPPLPRPLTTRRTAWYPNLQTSPPSHKWAWSQLPIHSSHSLSCNQVHGHREWAWHRDWVWLGVTGWGLVIYCQVRTVKFFVGGWRFLVMPNYTYSLIVCPCLF